MRGIEGVTSVSVLPEGMLQRLVLQGRLGCDLRAAAMALIDPSWIESIVEREPTLEEAYVSILGGPQEISQIA